MLIDAYLKMLFLYCLHKIDGQRTIYSILHLFNGKKSSQTIQDAHLFHLTKLFGICQNITRLDMEKIIAELVEENLIAGQAEQIYKLTKEGNDYLQKLLRNEPIPKELNGWKFHSISNLFWERLSLLVQVTSELSHSNTKYLPIQRKKEYHLWLKNYLIQTRLSREELSVQLYNELIKCLDVNNEINPAILVTRFTGNRKIGLTVEQSAELLELDYYSYHLQFLSILHYMLEVLKTRKNSFPLLYLMISDQISNAPLTESTRKTFVLLNKGFKINEIAKIRKLKPNTIEDHIVEITLNIAGFDISPFISSEKQDLIIKAAKNNRSKQLKLIRQLVPDADYFQIRLVLAKAGDSYDT